MSKLPMLFRGSLPAAFITGLKTQTRRLVPEWQQPAKCWDGDGYISVAQRHNRYGFGVFGATEEECMANYKSDYSTCCPYGSPGHLLWVRETFWAWGRWETRFDPKKGRDAWHFVDMTRECGKEYQFETPAQVVTRRDVIPAWHKRPSIFMPRHASRITLEIVSVHVERLQEINADGCRAEGCPGGHESIPGYGYSASPKEHFHHVWQSINGPDSWDANPWVWVVKFKRVDEARSAA